MQIFLFCAVFARESTFVEFHTPYLIALTHCRVTLLPNDWPAVRPAGLMALHELHKTGSSYSRHRLSCVDACASWWMPPLLILIVSSFQTSVHSLLCTMIHNRKRRKALFNFVMLACIAQEGGAFTAITSSSAGVSIMRRGTTMQRTNTPLESQYGSDQSFTQLRASVDPDSAGVNGDSTPNTDFVPDDVGRFRVSP